MSTTAVSAGQIMDRVANLLNDPNKTDYTYNVMIPYMNMAIEELSEILEESNASPSSQTTSNPIVIPVGMNRITSPEDLTVGVPHYPDDLTEIQEVGERASGSNDQFLQLTRKEFLSNSQPNNSLLFWCWEDQQIKFNPSGALGAREVQLKYVRQGIPYIVDATSIINTINVRAYLSYKTAALCALFIGENETRAGVLQSQAEKAIERTANISNKGRQQIMTRHRPFRASYKMRGY
jgi:hypothetical protein